MQRREFLSGMAAATAVGTTSSSAIDIISNSLMNDESARMTASHFGPLRAFGKNGRFESAMDASELDFFPVSLTQGVVARTYDDTRIAKPSVRKGYLKDGYKSDKSMRGKDE
ncbi:hypothetical protein [Campylobacter californiensis]|nr:hypothetical protein [Campylobacter sp. RM12916]